MSDRSERTNPLSTPSRSFAGGATALRNARLPGCTGAASPREGAPLTAGAGSGRPARATTGEDLRKPMPASGPVRHGRPVRHGGPVRSPGPAQYRGEALP